MSTLETLKIDLKGMKTDHEQLVFTLGDVFFDAVGTGLVNGGNVRADVRVHRMQHAFEVSCHIEGYVIVPCDMCLEPMEQAVEADNRLVVKLGETYSEDDDLITVNEAEGLLDLSWFIYEFIALAVPIKHVHAPGKCNPAMIDALEAHSAARSSDGADSKPIDPRWSELEKLKSIIKD